ncbi:protein archease isoform X1 [Anguilla rostrata]
MNDRELDLTEAQKAIKAKYPPINKKYEYLDHTADVQLHSWGDSMEEAFEQVAMAMFGYMTDTETVEPIDTVEVESKGDDMESLLFHFLDDWLFKFSADLFFVPRVRAATSTPFARMCCESGIFKVLFVAPPGLGPCFLPTDFTLSVVVLTKMQRRMENYPVISRAKIRNATKCAVVIQSGL